MEGQDVTIDLTMDMKDVSLYMSEMVKVLRGLATSLQALNESVNSIDFSLAEIRKFLILGA
jgi:hypothetical protein